MLLIFDQTENEPEKKLGHRHHQCDKERAMNKQGDIISSLPDDVLAEILSWLSLKEAISTCILSKRWKYVWTFISSSLCFDSGKKLCDKAFIAENFDSHLNDYKAKFVAWVNHVLKAHQATGVEELKVSFGLESTHSSELDSWVNFAVEKRVRRLEMNLTDFTGFSHMYPYTFPCVDKLKLPSNYTRLTSLHLISVNVCAEVVHHFLQKCPFLEQLCLVRSKTTTNLKIAGGDSSKLKYFDLYSCRPLENLEISAPNLVYFSYNGPHQEVPFKNVPLLSELFIAHKYCESFLLEAHKHSSYLSQLKKLTIIVPKLITVYPPSNLPILCNLKMLELRVAIPFPYCPTWFVSMIKAAPTLSKCVVKWLFLGPPPTTIVEQEKYPFKLPRHHRCSIECSHHQCLKEMEFVGFVGLDSVFRLTVFLLEVSAVLEKVTVDTRSCGFQWGPDVFCNAFADKEVDDREGVRVIAQKLRSYVPPGAEFLIV